MVREGPGRRRGGAEQRKKPSPTLYYETFAIHFLGSLGVWTSRRPRRRAGFCREGDDRK
jgi:hypothetical protein